MKAAWWHEGCEPFGSTRVNEVSTTPDADDLAAQAEALRSELADA